MSKDLGEQNLIPSTGPVSEQALEECAAEEFGFSFVKNGFEHVAPDLVENFSDYGLEVVGMCPVVLKPAVVDYIYRDSKQEPFYTAMYRHLVTTSVIALALHGQGQNAQATLNDLKRGTNGRPCLRDKYAPELTPIPQEEIEAWYKGVHPQQDAMTVLLTQRNVFHAADDSAEAIESLRLLTQHNPEFWKAVKQEDPRIEKLAKYLTASQAAVILA